MNGTDDVLLADLCAAHRQAVAAVRTVRQLHVVAPALKWLERPPEADEAAWCQAQLAAHLLAAAGRRWARALLGPGPAAPVPTPRGPQHIRPRSAD